MLFVKVKSCKNILHPLYQGLNKTHVKCFYLLAVFISKPETNCFAKISQFFINVGDADHQQPKNREHCQFYRKKFIFSTKPTPTQNREQ